MNRVRIKLDDISLIDFRHILYDDGAGSVYPVRREECVCAAQAYDSFKNVPKVAHLLDKVRLDSETRYLSS